MGGCGFWRRRRPAGRSPKRRSGRRPQVFAKESRQNRESQNVCGNPSGRPSKLTPALADAIVVAARGGATVKAAAEDAGVGRRRLYGWIERGRREPHGVFLARLDAALNEKRQPDWREALVRLEDEFEHWQPLPIREVLRDVDELL